MQKIVSLLTKETIDKDLLSGARARNVDQKHIYIDVDGAENYYTVAHKNDKKVGGDIPLDSFCSLIQNNIKKDAPLIATSLGCGNSEKEKYILQSLIKNGYTVRYVGMDTSHTMLEMSIQNLEDLDIPKEFVQADLAQEDFKEYMIKSPQHDGTRIYMFLGNTLGNVNQTYIADILYNVLQPQDYLWLEFHMRPDTSMETEMKIFNRYTEFLNDPSVAELFFHPLNKLGIPYASGKINLKTSKEPSVGALLVSYYFTFNEKVVITIHGESLHFLPGEEINIQNIRIYHLDTLISFFQEHEFKLIATDHASNRGQILFQK